MATQQQQGSYAMANAFQRYNLTSFVDNDTVSLPRLLPVVDEYILVSLFASSFITCIIVVCILSRSYSTRGPLTLTSGSGHFCMLVNLSISDICFLITALPATLVYNSDTYTVFSEPLGGAVCSAVHYVIYVTCYVSMYTMVVTTVFLLCTELIGHWTLLSRLSASVSCVIIWTAFLVANISTLIHPPSPEFLACSYATGETGDVSDTGEPTGRRVWIMFLVFAFLLPLTVISVLSGVILQCQRRREVRSRFLASRPPPPPPLALLPSTPQVQLRQPASLTLSRRPLASLDRQAALRHLANDDVAKPLPSHLSALATDARQLNTPSPASSSASAGGRQQQQQQNRVYRNKMPHNPQRTAPTVDLLSDERRYKPPSSQQIVGGFASRSAAINEEQTPGAGGTISAVGGIAPIPTPAGGGGSAGNNVMYQRNGCLVDVLFHRDYCADDLPSASMQNSPVCDLYGVTGRENSNGGAGNVIIDADGGSGGGGGGECHHCGHSLECHWNKSQGHSTDQDSQSETCTDVDHPTTIKTSVSSSQQQQQQHHKVADILSTARETSILGDSGISSPPFGRKGYFRDANTNNSLNVYDFGLYDNPRLKNPTLSSTIQQPTYSGVLEDDFDIPKMPVFTTVAGRDVNGLLRSPSTDKRYTSISKSSRLQSPPPPLPPRFDTTRPTYVSFDSDAGIMSPNIYNCRQFGDTSGTLLQLQQPSSTLARYRQNTMNSKQPTLEHHPPLSTQSLKRCNGNCPRSHQQPSVAAAGMTVRRISDTLTLSTLQDDRSDVTTTTAAGPAQQVTCACCTFARTPPNEQNVRRHKEMTILVMATAVSRALCWFPFQIFVISSVYELVLSASAHHTFGAIAVCLVFISPCFSPIIYYAASLDFRRLCNSIFFSDHDSSVNNVGLPNGLSKCHNHTTHVHNGHGHGTKV